MNIDIDINIDINIDIDLSTIEKLFHRFLDSKLPNNYINIKNINDILTLVQISEMFMRKWGFFSISLPSVSGT